MRHTNQYRQDVAKFRDEIDRVLAVAKKPKSGRLIVDQKGYESRAIATKSMEQRMALYGYERFESVARVLGLFELLRETENLSSRPRPVVPKASSAVWQAFRGTKDSNACHTCPTHLQLNGHLPTLITQNVGMQRHLVIEFANCILMPRSINEIDKVFDEQAGRSSFVEAAELILNERGAKWSEGVSLFLEGVRDFLGPAHDILFDVSGKSFLTREPEDQERVNMFIAYYEGLYLTPLNVPAVQTMLAQTEAEVGREPAEGGTGSGLAF